jgi:hypothetical protein
MNDILNFKFGVDEPFRSVGTVVTCAITVRYCHTEHRARAGAGAAHVQPGVCACVQVVRCEGVSHFLMSVVVFRRVREADAGNRLQ